MLQASRKWCWNSKKELKKGNKYMELPSRVSRMWHLESGIVTACTSGASGKRGKRSEKRK